MSEDLTVDANKEINRKFCSTSAETLDTVPAIVVSNEWEDSVCHSPPESPVFLRKFDSCSSSDSIQASGSFEKQGHALQTGSRNSSGSYSELTDSLKKRNETNIKQSGLLDVHSENRHTNDKNENKDLQKDEFVGKSVLRRKAASRHIQRRSRVSRTSSSGSSITLRNKRDSVNSDVFEDCKESFSFSDGSSDEYCECRSVSYYEVEKSTIVKLRRIVNELVNTEKTYVKNLYLIDQVFQEKIKKENAKQNLMPPEIIPQMFSNIASIYQFHSGYLLSNLENRVANWETSQKIGDIMKGAAPFFKLYTEFMNNFDHAMNVLTIWEERCPVFADILMEIQCLPECNRLSIKHHMLSPVQRLPRYELLLKDYIKHLPENSEDLKDAKDALVLVTEATTHANEALKNEKFQKLMEVSDKIGGVINIFTPTREFVKEGPVIKITARKGIKQERYLFLFNDLLLVCSQYLLGKFKIKDQLDVEGMEVVEKEDSEYIQLVNGEENFDVPDSFYVRSPKKIVQFCYGSENSEDIDWCSLIKDVIEKFQVKRRSFFRESMLVIDTKLNRTSSSVEFELGETAPKWVKDHETDICMKCQTSFSTLRRRHHCRACGFVVCATCSTKKIALRYDDNNLNRVCDTCYDILLSKQRELCCGFLNVSKDKGKTWKNIWFSVRTDGHLHYYKTRQDMHPSGSYNLKLSTFERAGEENIFKLVTGNKTLYLYSDTQKSNKKWMDVLSKMVSSESSDQ